MALLWVLLFPEDPAPSRVLWGKQRRQSPPTKELPALEARSASHREQFPSTLVSYGCHDKLPQIWWPETTQINFLTVLEARSLVQVSMAKIKMLTELYSLLEALGETLLPCLFQLLEAVCIPWLLAPSSTFKARNAGCVFLIQHSDIDLLASCFCF